MIRSAFAAALVCALVVACSGSEAPSGANESRQAPEPGREPQARAAPAAAAPSSTAQRAAPAPVRSPVAPAAPRGDSTPVPEAPFTPTSAQGAANVVQTYYALLESRRYADAWRLWGGGGAASGKSLAAFAADFARYREYHAEIGAPGRIEGAAGSLYTTVPVRLYGRLRSGTPFREAAIVTLRRVNEVPGATPAERRWHIATIAPRG